MVDTIMTNTVPTIIGMGVASRAVDTMFSRRGPRPGRRAPLKGKRIKSRPGPTIHKGPRGGRYIIRKGRRVYI